jgi:hypothetical protein
MTIAPNVLDVLPPPPYEQARTLVADADILLCSAHDQMSRCRRRRRLLLGRYLVSLTTCVRKRTKGLLF